MKLDNDDNEKMYHGEWMVEDISLDSRGAVMILFGDR